MKKDLSGAKLSWAPVRIHFMAAIVIAAIATLTPCSECAATMKSS